MMPARPSSQPLSLVQRQGLHCASRPVLPYSVVGSCSSQKQCNRARRRLMSRMITTRSLSSSTGERARAPPTHSRERAGAGTLSQHSAHGTSSTLSQHSARGPPQTIKRSSSATSIDNELEDEEPEDPWDIYADDYEIDVLDAATVRLYHPLAFRGGSSGSGSSGSSGGIEVEDPCEKAEQNPTRGKVLPSIFDDGVEAKAAGGDDITVLEEGGGGSASSRGRDNAASSTRPKEARNQVVPLDVEEPSPYRKNEDYHENRKLRHQTSPSSSSSSAVFDTNDSTAVSSTSSTSSITTSLPHFNPNVFSTREDHFGSKMRMLTRAAQEVTKPTHHGSKKDRSALAEIIKERAVNNGATAPENTWSPSTHSYSTGMKLTKNARRKRRRRLFAMADPEMRPPDWKQRLCGGHWFDPARGPIKVRVLDVDKLSSSDLHTLFMHSCVRFLPAEACLKIAHRVALFREKWSQSSYENLLRHCTEDYFSKNNGAHAAELLALFTRCHSTLSVPIFVDYIRKYGKFSRQFLAKLIDKQLQPRTFDFVRYESIGGVAPVHPLVARPYHLSSFLYCMGKSQIKTHLLEELRTEGLVSVNPAEEEEKALLEARMAEGMLPQEQRRPLRLADPVSRPPAMETVLASLSGEDVEEKAYGSLAEEEEEIEEVEDDGYLADEKEEVSEVDDHTEVDEDEETSHTEVAQIDEASCAERHTNRENGKKNSMAAHSTTGFAEQDTADSEFDSTCSGDNILELHEDSKSAALFGSTTAAAFPLQFTPVDASASSSTALALVSDRESEHDPSSVKTGRRVLRIPERAHSLAIRNRAWWHTYQRNNAVVDGRRSFVLKGRVYYIAGNTWTARNATNFFRPRRRYPKHAVKSARKYDREAKKAYARYQVLHGPLRGVDGHAAGLRGRANFGGGIKNRSRKQAG
ncbi:unnamed protein product [Amoebophrya sp. A25]|nr:unnamed protein product [Amoebophrya sp. A25]|eukprot:GSA25T00027223001.1